MPQLVHDGPRELASEEDEQGNHPEEVKKASIGTAASMTTGGGSGYTAIVGIKT